MSGPMSCPARNSDSSHSGTSPDRGVERHPGGQQRHVVPARRLHDVVHESAQPP